MTYVGNYGYDIEITRNINALPNQYLNADNARTAAMVANNTFLSASVANPFAGLLPGSGFNNATIARRQLLRPYPQFGDINTTNNDGKTWYHSLQASLQKRFAKGYTLGFSYTYSHWMQATEYLNAGDANPTKMISDLDVPHRLSISGIYELPFGKRQALRDGRERAWCRASSAAGRLQGVYTFQAGFPVRFGTDAFYNGGRHRARRPQHAEVDQHRRLHVDPDRDVHRRDAGRPPADAAVPVLGRARRHDQQHGPVAHQEREAAARDGGPAARRVHQRAQQPVPGDGRRPDHRQPDVEHVRADHRVEPAELRAPRAARREAPLLTRAGASG